jgi:late competence protein required for DNA uptake (superfamily II DNA/RNA helicase)
MNTVIDKIYNYFEHEPELKVLSIFNDDFLNLELHLLLKLSEEYFAVQIHILITTTQQLLKK